jgi:predicted translin family RNA/ssDNA-binding protein
MEENKEIKKLEAKLDVLSKKLDEQMRISRNLTALCTTVIIGVMFFIFTQTIQHLPSIIVFHYMSNLDAIVKEWKQTEKAMDAAKLK